MREGKSYTNTLKYSGSYIELLIIVSWNVFLGVFIPRTFDRADMQQGLVGVHFCFLFFFLSPADGSDVNPKLRTTAYYTETDDIIQV